MNWTCKESGFTYPAKGKQLRIDSCEVKGRETLFSLRFAPPVPKFWSMLHCFKFSSYLVAFLPTHCHLPRPLPPLAVNFFANFRISPYGEQRKAPRLLESCRSVVRSRNLNTVKPLQARSRGNKWFKTQMNKLQWSPYPEETRTELWSLVLLAGWMLTWGPFKEAQALFISHETAVESKYYNLLSRIYKCLQYKYALALSFFLHSFCHTSYYEDLSEVFKVFLGAALRSQHACIQFLRQTTTRLQAPSSTLGALQLSCGVLVSLCSHPRKPTSACTEIGFVFPGLLKPWTHRALEACNIFSRIVKDGTPGFFCFFLSCGN